jgi:hypothetical protein
LVMFLFLLDCYMPSFIHISESINLRVENREF